MNKLRIKMIQEGTSNRNGKYVIYYMQQSQRIHYNHALKYAIDTANQKGLPVMIIFALQAYPEANIRSYTFMLEGLKDVYRWAGKLNLNMIIKVGKPREVIEPYLSNAYTLVMDKGYLKPQEAMRRELLLKAKDYSLDIIEIDTDLIVPVEVASNKVEYGAYTIRPKLNKLYDDFNDFDKLPDIKNKTNLNLSSDVDIFDINQTLNTLKIEDTLSASPLYKGGYIEAQKKLFDFINSKINHYEESSDPSTDYTSLMSMYLHFGQISSLEILNQLELALSQNRIKEEAFLAFKEQLFIRRELAFNYVFYNPRYDDFYGMTEPWAYETIDAHKEDDRPYLYEERDYLNYQTHDPYFNAAMKEMVETGYMHNYMRMYWAKKIIEWSKTHEEAYKTILKLNNRYFIDGRDPNSYAGVAWCFGKHDRAWTERPIFGKLRYMNDKGLERKFDMQGYINKVTYR